jgi:hypothetical protein
MATRLAADRTRQLYAVLASAGDGKGEDRYYPLISAPRTQARLGRCSSAGPRPAAAGAAIRACARPLGS